MTFKDLFKKTYIANCYCLNCGTHQETQVPKGITITQFMESATGKCNVCGCCMLTADYKQIDEIKSTRQKTEIKQPQFKPLPRATVPNPRPLPRSAPTQQRPAAPIQQEVQRPRPEDFRPKKVYKDDLDFWAGSADEIF